MSEMSHEQFSALAALLNFCRRAERNRQLDVKEWQRHRDRMNKAFIQPGPPKSKLEAGPISDLMRGVPVSVVAEKNGLSRGTVYRIIKDHPQLAKIWEPKFKTWEEKRKTKQDTTSDSESILQAEASASQSVQESQLNEDTAESIPSPSQVETDTEELMFVVNLRDINSQMNLVDTCIWIVKEITQNLEPFTDMDPCHEFYTSLPKLARRELVRFLVIKKMYISELEVTELAKRIVIKANNSILLPLEILAFAGLVGGESDYSSVDRSAQDVIQDFLVSHRPFFAKQAPGVISRRMALISAMVQEGLGTGSELEQLDNESLAERIRRRSQPRDVG